MTVQQVKAVAYCQCGVPRMKDKLDVLRSTLKKLLSTVSATVPIEDMTPEFPTQDPDDYDAQQSHQVDGSDTTASDLVAFEDLAVGEIVEVFWEGEHTWFEGEVKDVNEEDREFEVYYPGDGETLWHKPEWYPVRFCE